MFLSDSSLKRQPFAIGRPVRIARDIFLAADANRFLCCKVHDPELRNWAPWAVVRDHRIGKATAVRRQNNSTYEMKTGKIAARQTLRFAEWSNSKNPR